MRYSDFRTFLLIAAFGAASFYPGLVQAAGPYMNSAHGNNTYGVSRSEIAAAGFARGNCAHCHEQHASAGTEQGYLIFDQNNTDQARNFCFNCHGTGIGHVVNRSYSFRAGGWTTELLDNVKDAFSPTLASSHNLADIVTFVVDKAWTKENTTTNACGVCHDPHQVQGDPANKPDDAKGGLNPRAHVITQVNTSPVNLWGDGYLPDLVTPNPIEIMSNYSINYLDPNRIGGGFEPDGSSTQQNGGNLANYVDFCTTCHDAANVINSNDLGRQLKYIDWPLVEKHGQVAADDDTQMNAPYVSGSFGYVLSCLDCHEPHGSDNIYLLRGAVNGDVLTGTITTGVEFELICKRCHNPNPLTSGADWDDVHHNTSVDGPYNRASCLNCHVNADGSDRINCENCHFHGASTGSAVNPSPTNAPLGDRVTF